MKAEAVWEMQNSMEAVRHTPHSKFSQTRAPVIHHEGAPKKRRPRFQGRHPVGAMSQADLSRLTAGLQILFLPLAQIFDKRYGLLLNGKEAAGFRLPEAADHRLVG